MTDMEKQAFGDRYQRILERIAGAAEASGRTAADITLLAATKTVSPERINQAIDQGVSCIGENRVQEFLEKYPSLYPDQVDCQFIGRLQTNKVKYIVDKVSLIQSVDSVKLAKEIARISQKQGKVSNILLEVNIGGEAAKAGIAPGALYETLDEIRQIQGVHVKGLMSIPPDTEDLLSLSKFFQRMHKYYVDITAKTLDNVSMTILSMGMSGDYELAIREGANMVRIGSALFGGRS